MNKVNELAEQGMSYEDFRTILGDGITAPDTYYNRALFSQAVHETGNFTSRIWKETKNAFGMRPAQSRHKFYSWKLSTGTGDYAGYDTHKDTISDRIDLDRNFRRDIDLQDYEDVQDYMQHVKDKGYATDPLYVTKWNTIYNQLFPSNNAVSGTIGQLDGEIIETKEHLRIFGIKSTYLIIVAIAGALWFLKRKLSK